MTSRIAAILTIIGLAAGTGGALAVAAHNGGNPHGGAASDQYRPGKGCGDTNHIHTGPPPFNDSDGDNTAGVNNSPPDGDKDDCGPQGHHFGPQGHHNGPQGHH